MSAEYKLKTVADFLTIPEEKLDACFQDFKHWLFLARKSGEVDTAMANLFGVGVSFNKNAFSWVDDGQSGISSVDFVTETEYVGRLDIRKEQ